MGYKYLPKFIALLLSCILIASFATALPVAAAPLITLNPTGGPPGTTVQVTGSGWPVGAQVEIVAAPYWGGPAITAAVDAGGLISTVMHVPDNAPSNTYNIYATASIGGAFASTQFIVYDGFALGSNNGFTGDTISVSGIGFTPGQSVPLYWDNNTATPLANLVASASGTVNTNIIIPASVRGTHTISTTGGSRSVPFTVKSRIILTATIGAAGDMVGVIGSGFAANAQVLVSGISGLTPVNLLADNAGSFFTVFYVPEAAPVANYTVTAGDSGGSASAAFTVFPRWTANLIPANGAHDVAIDPTNFDWNDLAEATSYEFQLAEGNEVPVTADTITLTQSGYAVADLAQNTLYSWRIRGIIGTVTGDWVNSTFTTAGEAPDTPPTTVTVTAPPVTTTVTFTSPPATSTQTVTVTEPPQTVAITVTAPPVTVTRPPAGGSSSVTISQDTSQSEPGYVGMELTVNGTGFKPASVITITFESTPITVAAVNSDGNGAFTATFNAPAAPGGIHTIRATDGTTTREFAFIMDSTAPERVTLFVPVASQPVFFNWSASDDPSGVTYILQISHDPAFSAVILEKDGLETAAYQMTASEKLTGAGHYYWRVRAVDRAGNIGPWSEVNSFSLGFVWPDWTIYALMGAGAFLILLFGLFTGHRMAQRDY